MYVAAPKLTQRSSTPVCPASHQTLDANQKPVPGVVVEVWEQNGVLVNTYTSDTTGVIQTDHLRPATTSSKSCLCPTVTP